MEDVLLLTAGILAEDERVAAQVRRQYKWFVVDEFQDVSPLQSALLDLWLGGRDELCVVGDPAQTIYSFAGANADFLRDFPTKYPGTTSVELVRNYRSTPQVVEAANRLLAGTVEPQRRPPLPAGRRPRGHLRRPPRRGGRGRGGRRPHRSRCARRAARSARWRSCSASTPSPRPSRRRCPPRASPTSSAARPGSSTVPRSARRSPGSAARPAPARARTCVETVRATLSGDGLDRRGAVRPRPDPRPLGVLAGADGPGDRVRRRRPSTSSSTTSTAAPPSSTPRSPTASRSRRSTPPRGSSGTRCSSCGLQDGTLPITYAETPGGRSRRSAGCSTSA